MKLLMRTMKKFRTTLMIALFTWLLQGCVATEALYAKYDEHACRVAMVKTPSGKVLVQELGTTEEKTMAWEPAVYFELGKDDISPKAEQLLDKDIAVLNQYRELRVSVRGYADQVGSAGFNQKLSKRRTVAAVDYLVAGGISRSRIEQTYEGEGLPVIQTKDGQEQAVN